ncbi:unnamed protein product, partial [Phaeothamnion confervicola]
MDLPGAREFPEAAPGGPNVSAVAPASGAGYDAGGVPAAAPMMLGGSAAGQLPPLLPQSATSAMLQLGSLPLLPPPANFANANAAAPAPLTPTPATAQHEAYPMTVASFATTALLPPPLSYASAAYSGGASPVSGSGTTTAGLSMTSFGGGTTGRRSGASGSTSPVDSGIVRNAKRNNNNVDSEFLLPLSSLHFAVRRGNAAAIAHLFNVEKSRPYEAHVDSDGCSPLHWAAALWQVDCLAELLKHKSKWSDRRDREGLLPLHVACRFADEVFFDGDGVEEKAGNVSDGCKEKDALLPQNGSLPKEEVNGGTTSDEEAWDDGGDSGGGCGGSGGCGGGNRTGGAMRAGPPHDMLRCLEMLLQREKGGGLDGEDSSLTLDGQSVLHVSAAAGNEPAIQYLLQKIHRKARLINAQDGRGQTPLYCACKQGRTGVVQMLLDKRANISLKASNGLSPLQVAAYRGHTNCVRLLLRASCVPGSLEDRGGRSAVHFAAAGGHTETLQLLLNEPNMKVDAVGERNWTALHHAARRGRTEVVALLLSQGASPSTHDVHLRTPLHWACSASHGKGCVAALVAAGAPMLGLDVNSHSCLVIAAEAGNVGCVEELWRASPADFATLLATADREGVGPLATALRGGHEACALRLLE